MKESFMDLYKKLAMLSEEAEQLDELSPELLSRAGAEAKRRQQRAANVLPVGGDFPVIRIKSGNQLQTLGRLDKIQKAIGLGDLTPDTQLYGAQGEELGTAKDVPQLQQLFKPENPASQFFGQKADKFNNAARAATTRDQKKDQYNRQTANMSQAQRRRFDKMQQGEKVNEWANQIGKGPGKGTDASFEQDIDFMTKVISGGLNKPKSTGQTTVPVVASQLNRQNDQQHVNESFMHLYKKLAILSEESAERRFNAAGDLLSPKDDHDGGPYQNPNRHPDTSDDELDQIKIRDRLRNRGPDDRVEYVGRRMKKGSAVGLNAQGDWGSYEDYFNERQRLLYPDLFVDDNEDDPYQNPNRFPPNRSPDPSDEPDADEIEAQRLRDLIRYKDPRTQPEYVGRRMKEGSDDGLDAEGNWRSYGDYFNQRQRLLHPELFVDDDEDDSYQNPNRSPDPSYDEEEERYGILKREIDRKGDVRQVGRMKEGSDDGLDAEGNWRSYGDYFNQRQRLLHPELFVDDDEDDSYQDPNRFPPNRSPDPSYDEEEERYGILKREIDRKGDVRQVGRTIGGYDQPTERNPYGNQKFNVPPGREFRPRPHTPDGLEALKKWKELGPSDRKEEL